MTTVKVVQQVSEVTWKKTAMIITIRHYNAQALILQISPSSKDVNPHPTHGSQAHKSTLKPQFSHYLHSLSICPTDRTLLLCNGPEAPSKLPLPIGSPGPHKMPGSLDSHESISKLAHNQQACFCIVHQCVEHMEIYKQKPHYVQYLL